MTTKFPCYIQFTDSGSYCKIVHQSGMIVAEIICPDVHFMNRAESAYDRLGLKNIPRPPEPYRAELLTILDRQIILEEIETLKEMLVDYEMSQININKIREETLNDANNERRDIRS